MLSLTRARPSCALSVMPNKRQATSKPQRRVRREPPSAPRARPPTWASRIAAIQREVSGLFHAPLPRKLASVPTVLLSLKTINIILNGLRHLEGHDANLIEKLHNVARGGNMYSSAGADVLDVVLHVRTIKLIWPDQLADGVRERLSQYGSTFAEETTERIDELLVDAEPTNLKTFAAPVADLIIDAWARAGRPVRESASATFAFPVEPKSTDARTRRALLTRILNAIARHDDGPPRACQTRPAFTRSMSGSSDE